MSKANVQTTSQTEATAGAADGQTAVVPAAKATQTPAPDERHGHGGFYTVVNGKRQLVNATKSHNDGKAKQ